MFSLMYKYLKPFKSVKCPQKVNNVENIYNIYSILYGNSVSKKMMVFRPV